MKTSKTPIDYFRGDPGRSSKRASTRLPARRGVRVLGGQRIHGRPATSRRLQRRHLLGSYFNHLYELMDIHHDQIFKGFVTQARRCSTR